MKLNHSEMQQAMQCLLKLIDIFSKSDQTEAVSRLGTLAAPLASLCGHEVKMEYGESLYCKDCGIKLS